MAGAKGVASLVILTDSVEVLRKHVNSGRVFKVQDPTPSSTRDSSNEEAELSSESDSSESMSNEIAKLYPEEYVSCDSESIAIAESSQEECCFLSNLQSDKLQSPDECGSWDSESTDIAESSQDECSSSNLQTFNLYDEATQCQLPSRTTEMKEGRLFYENHTSEVSGGEIVKFENKPKSSESIEDRFASFRLNDTFPFKTYSKRQPEDEERNKQFNRLFNTKSHHSLSNLNERKHKITKSCSSSYQITDSENELHLPIKKSKLSLNQKTKSTNRSVEEKKPKEVTEKLDETASQSTDSVDKLESRTKVPHRKKSKARKSRRISTISKLNSLSNNESKEIKSERRLRIHKCITCKKTVCKVISSSKYAFRFTSHVNSSICKKCRIK